MNYTTNKVQVSYFVKLPRSNFPDYTNSLTFPWLWAFSLTLAEFPDISRFPEIPEKWKPCSLLLFRREWLRKVLTARVRHCKPTNSIIKRPTKHLHRVSAGDAAGVSPSRTFAEPCRAIFRHTAAPDHSSLSRPISLLPSTHPSPPHQLLKLSVVEPPDTSSVSVSTKSIGRVLIY